MNAPKTPEKNPNDATRISLTAVWFAGLCVVATFGATALVRIALRGLDFYGLAWELVFGTVRAAVMPDVHSGPQGD